MNSSLKDDETDESIAIESNLLVTSNGLASFLFQKHEINEWIAWLGFSLDDSASINRKDHVLILELAM